MSGSSNAHATAPAEGGPVPAGVAETLSALWHAVAARRLYGRDHPSDRRASDEGLKATHALEAGGLPLLVAVGPERLECHDASVGEGGELEALRALLRNGTVAAVSIHRRPSAAEFSQAVDWLSTLDRSGESRTATAADWLKPIWVSGHALRFVNESESADGDKWKVLIGSLAGGEASSGSSQVQTSARTLRELLERAPAEQAGIARRVLESMASADVGRDAAPTTDDRWIGATLASLPEDLRRSILALGAVGSPGWMQRHASAMPVGEVSAVLRGLAEAGVRPPNATLMMMQKLMLLTELSATVRQELEDTSKAWVGSSSGGASTLAELMAGEGTQDYCPDDYRSNLTAVASQTIAQSIGHVWKDDFEAEATASRVAQIAMWLSFDQPRAGVSNSAVFAVLAQRAAELPIDELRALVARLGQQGGGAGGSDPRAGLEEGWSRIIDALQAPIVIERLLADLTGDRWDPAVMSAMLKIDGVGTARQVIARVSTARMSPSHPQVRSTAGEVVQEELARACVDALAAGHDQLAGVLAVLYSAHAASAQHVGLALLSVPDGTVRREAVRVLDERGERWSESLTLAALVDGEAIVGERAAGRLLSGRNDVSCEGLGRLLTHPGGSGNGEVEDRVSLCVVTALTRRGGEGLRTLIDALEKLRRTVSRSQIRTCRRIAEALEPHAKQPEVARAVRQWRRSIGFTVGLFVVEDTRRRAA